MRVSSASNGIIPASRVPLREIVLANASPQTPGEHRQRSASLENELIQAFPNTQNRFFRQLTEISPPQASHQLLVASLPPLITA